jgi:hypothetical protein
VAVDPTSPPGAHDFVEFACASVTACVAAAGSLRTSRPTGGAHRRAAGRAAARGATSSTYTATATDVGRRLRLRVLASSDQLVSEPATSAATASVGGTGGGGAGGGTAGGTNGGGAGGGGTDGGGPSADATTLGADLAPLTPEAAAVEAASAGTPPAAGGFVLVRARVLIRRGGRIIIQLRCPWFSRGCGGAVRLATAAGAVLTPDRRFALSPDGGVRVILTMSRKRMRSLIARGRGPRRAVLVVTDADGGTARTALVLVVTRAALR